MKKFSKLMAVLLALVMCLSLMPMAVFAVEEECDHNWVYDHCWMATSAKIPNCQTAHDDVYRCTKCNATEKHHGQTHSHSMQYKQNSVITSKHTAYCTNCVWEENLRDHRFENATCQTPGKCKCGATDKTVSCDYSVPATCVSAATCKWCGAEDPNGQPDPNNHAEGCTLSSTWAINVNEHYKQYSLCGTKVSHAPCEVGVTAVPATCQHAGTTAGTKCSTCDTILSGVEADPKKDHNFTGEYVQGTTGTGSAGHAQKCVYGCGEHSIFVPHTGEWTVVDEPTCTVEGSKTFECTACGYTASQKIPATGHKDEDGDKKCDDCDADLNCQHEWEWQNTYEATCTNIGYKVEYCAKCDTSQVIKTADKLNHDFQDTENTVDTATCTQAGEKTQYCSRCDATQNVETKVLGHKYGELQAEIPATCLEDGTQAHYECVRCHKLFTTGTTAYDSVEELKIAAPGSHAWDAGVVTTPAGETTEGVRTFTCTRTGCGATRTEAIPATGGTGGGDTGDGTGGGEEIEEPDVPLVGGPDDGEMLIDEPEVPLAGLMTRAEFVNYLYVQAGAPEAQASTFTDVPEDHEYAAAIGWAQANGIAKGITEDEFAPDEIVSVEQAELFLLRYAQFKGVEMPELAALAGKDPLEILDNADEVLAEFFEAIRPQSQAA